MTTCTRCWGKFHCAFLTQKERDNESGLDYFLARYYSSAQGRFTSPDEFTGGPDEFWILGSSEPEKQALPYAEITNPQSLNKYQYSYNNPLRYVDPDGHQQLPPEWFIKVMLRYHQWKEGAKAYAQANAPQTDFHDGESSGAAQKFGPLDMDGREIARKHFDAYVKGSDLVAEVIGYLDPVGAADIVRNYMKGDREGVITATASSLLGKFGIKGFTKHGINQIIERGVKPSAILDALKSPLKVGKTVIDSKGRASQRIIGKNAEVVVNPETSVIVSVNKTSKKKAKRLARQLED